MATIERRIEQLEQAAGIHEEPTCIVVTDGPENHPRLLWQGIVPSIRTRQNVPGSLSSSADSPPSPQTCWPSEGSLRLRRPTNTEDAGGLCQRPDLERNASVA